MSEHAFHMQAFVDFMRFASGEPSLVERFERETSMRYVPPANALEAAIDKATGHEDKLAEAFVLWCADEYGREYLPKDIMGAIRRGPKEAA